jgi:class 3 adenylate cyclase
MTTLLDEKLDALREAGFSDEIREHIRAHIEHAGPACLQRISPSRMAQDWDLPQRDVLEAFLHGTRLGIFDLMWAIRCPFCQGHVEQIEHLSSLKSQSRCEFCQMDFQAGFDDVAEVTFRLNENIRRVAPATRAEGFECWDLIEIDTSFTVKPGSTWEQQIDLKVGTYYLYDPDFRVGMPLAVHPGISRSPQQMEVIFDGEKLVRPEGRAYQSGPMVLRVVNHSPQPTEMNLWRRKQYPWTSAAQVASTQSFRDLFSSELISPDETFAIRDLVIVFTDIKGSTALYERLGDSDAYFLVKEHFKILIQQVRAHNGAVVKTIGDAVMATFLVSQDAIEALFDVQAAFDAFNAREQTRDDIIIKIGAHRGPCIAVTSNDRLDYFGRTVNVASRVQGLSSGRDIVFTRSFYDEPEVREIVDGSSWQIRHFEARLRGIDDLYDVVHLLPPE